MEAIPADNKPKVPVPVAIGRQNRTVDSSWFGKSTITAANRPGCLTLPGAT